MSSLLKRGGKLYAKIKDADGVWQQVATGLDVDQEEAAWRWIADREIEVEREVRRRVGKPIEDELTLNGWAKEWGEMRSALERDGNHDYARIRDHVLPHIGHMLVKDIRPKHLFEVFTTILKTPLKVTGAKPAPRTVHNVYLALCALFRDAVTLGKTEQSPCVLTTEQLGEKVDQDPEWRAAALFTRDEVQTLISTSRIPWDRRVAYAIELLGGLRPGENAALRWKHYDPTNKPLGELVVALSLNSKRGTTKATKTKAVKHVPVHPTLAAILAEWKLHGWPLMVGRAPKPDDLIVPLPPADAQARTKRRKEEPFRTTYYAGRRWAEDLVELGWRDRAHYDMRATFITLALEDGADPEIIERRVTHTRKRRGAFDGYNRGKQWATVCAEVAKLQISRGPDEERAQQQLVGNLGAVLVQSKNSSATSASSGLRRRVSNPGLMVVDGGQCIEPRRGREQAPAPSGAGLHQTAPNMVKSACDLGLELLRISAVGPTA